MGNVGLCPYCGGDIVGGTCMNCGTPAPCWALPEKPDDLPPDIALALTGLAALIQTAGDDPGRPELEGTPDRAVAALLALTAGYERDPAAAFPPPAFATPPLEGVTLSLSVPLRTACERCMLPVFGKISVRCEPRDRPIDGGSLARLVGTLAARYQNEAQLAEQVAAALVTLGGAGSASVRLTTRRPCDECGAGQATTTARARRTAPAGGVPQQDGGG